MRSQQISEMIKVCSNWASALNWPSESEFGPGHPRMHLLDLSQCFRSEPPPQQVFWWAAKNESMWVFIPAGNRAWTPADWRFKTRIPPESAWRVSFGVNTCIKVVLVPWWAIIHHVSHPRGQEFGCTVLRASVMLESFCPLSIASDTHVCALGMRLYIIYKASS